MRLEIVCEGQILMPQLRLHDVYTQIWCANRNNVSECFLLASISIHSRLLFSIIIVNSLSG